MGLTPTHVFLPYVLVGVGLEAEEGGVLDQGSRRIKIQTCAVNLIFTQVALFCCLVYAL